MPVNLKSKFCLFIDARSVPEKYDKNISGIVQIKIWSTIMDGANGDP